MSKRIVQLVLLLLAMVTTHSPAPATPRPAPIDRVEVVRAPEVKLRKLHLVRPDLIPFPIFFEVYC